MRKAINKKNVLRLLGSFLLIFLVFRTLILSEVVSTLRNINLWVYLVSFLVFMGNRMVATYRWGLLLRVQDIDVPFWNLYNVVLFGVIFNRVLPATFGGDTARIYWLLKDQPDKKAASVIATLTDRILGLLALVILALAIVPFNHLVSAQIRMMGLALLAMFAIFMAILLWARSDWIARILRKLMFNDWLRQNLDQALAILKTFKNSKAALFATLFTAIIMQSITVVNQYLRFATIDVDVPLLYLFLAIPITTLIVTIPISIGGIGLRELTLINLLGYIGIESHQVVSYAIVGYSNILILSVGLVIYNLGANSIRKLLRWPIDSKHARNDSDI